MGTIPSKASPTSPILESVSTVVIQATENRFVVKGNRVIDISGKDEVNICSLSDIFSFSLFFDTGKIEGPNSQRTLHYHKLLKTSLDDQIIAVFGGEAKVVTTLLEIFSLMKKQKNGGKGVLLTNGRANIFYILDKNGVLRVVRVRWCGDCWYIYVDSGVISHRWYDRDQVFSRNLVL